MNSMMKKGYASGGMPMKDGKPAFVGDGKGKMAKGGMAKADLAKHASMPASKAHKGLKAGGMATKMGSVKTGSKPDGVAMKGKTKGTMVKMARGGKAC
jgi:hypothetical protein